MFLHPWPTNYTDLRQAISQMHRMDEASLVKQLLTQLQFEPNIEKLISSKAEELVKEVRNQLRERTAIQKFMQQYDLSTEEGVMLMCLAEALLRVPDVVTENLLIRDKLTAASWDDFVGRSESGLVNWATWGLALSGKVLDYHSGYGEANTIWKRLLQRCSEPIVRQAVHQAIKIMSEQFVLGRTIPQALQGASSLQKQGYLFSFDMLGEVARTMEDAERYLAAYEQAIRELKAALTQQKKEGDVFEKSGISIKLSALYPRYEMTQVEFAVPFLIKTVTHLAEMAQDADINLTLDAEEADRLEMSLDIFAAVFKQPQLNQWHGFGLAVQAYQKRALPVLKWLIQLAREHNRRIPVRLVKGAYWDTEIKLSQMGGYESYPVFTRKAATDLSYLVCAQEMIAADDALYSQFATHNAYSIAAIIHLVQTKTQSKPAVESKTFEFQSLQGMGRELHDSLINQGYRCRIYAPVGSHEDLLPYLVRRLLENGANSSFVNQIADPATPIQVLISNPREVLSQVTSIPHPKIPLPQNIFAPGRINSRGIDLSNYAELIELNKQIESFHHPSWEAFPSTSKSSSERDPAKAKPQNNPSDFHDCVGQVWETESHEVEQAVHESAQAFLSWRHRPVSERAGYLRNAADLLERHYPEFISLMMREAGKTINDCMSEIREAVDFFRYYSIQAETLMLKQMQPGVTGESNSLQAQGRGVMVCISPWNFPLSIFAGQISAALVTGNTVIAKPAEQTPLTAAFLVNLLYEAGIPRGVLHFLPGSGETVGAALTAYPQIAGVIFTGSTSTAKIIGQTLATRPGPQAELIAETGGMNAMIVDSTALPEQVIADVVMSAFNSAGQRCSALRVLCVQSDVADHMIKMLQGAMAELRVGSPLLLSTDIGPVIDQAAKDGLLAHAQFLEKNAQLIYRVKLPANQSQGFFVPPQAYEINDLKLLTQEVFGPILHVYRYRQDQLDQVIDSINAWGYGLTFGIHSRINAMIDYITQRIDAGNIYVNRNMIGAVVESQPFGGMRLSGTGPKAGGPHYLSRFCTEKTITINTTAMGGNASLMTLNDEP